VVGVEAAKEIALLRIPLVWLGKQLMTSLLYASLLVKADRFSIDQVKRTPSVEKSEPLSRFDTYML
jgi:hypothetical protein